MVYLARALKSAQNFTSFQGIEKKLNLFNIENLNFQDYEQTQGFPWERVEGVFSKDEREIVELFK